ncbi:MAG: esterase/lipase family protein [Frankiaceae bacterium]
MSAASKGEVVRVPVARAERLARSAGRGVRTVCSPTGIAGATRELIWLTAHALAYPFGVAPEPGCPQSARHSLDALPPLQRALIISDVEAAGTPILLVHGFVDNRSVFALLRRQLRRRGFGRIGALNYSVFTADVRTAAQQLADAVERLVDETGFERVHLVGHSLGGLVARYYVQRMGGDERVHTLVTLGTPHGGTRSAHLLPHRLCRQLRPGSDLLAELAEPAPGCRTRFLALWSDLDQLIVPRSAAQVLHPDLRATNVLVRGIGHMSLPIHPQIVHHICTALTHLDQDGSTLAAGATSIDAAAGRGWTGGPRQRAAQSQSV